MQFIDAAAEFLEGLDHRLDPLRPQAEFMRTLSPYYDYGFHYTPATLLVQGSRARNLEDFFA